MGVLYGVIGGVIWSNAGQNRSVIWSIRGREVIEALYGVLGGEK